MFNKKQHTGHFPLTRVNKKKKNYIPDVSRYHEKKPLKDYKTSYMTGSGADDFDDDFYDYNGTDVDYMHIKNEQTNQIRNQISDILELNEGIDIMEYDITEQPALEETEAQIQAEGPAPANHVGAGRERRIKYVGSGNPANRLMKNMQRYRR